jgi:hypothetical protein
LQVHLDIKQIEFEAASIRLWHAPAAIGAVVIVAEEFRQFLMLRVVRPTGIDGCQKFGKLFQLSGSAHLFGR